jgi:hypothetical protein
MGTMTPWGLSDQSKKIAVGINFYSCARHGGFKLSEGRMNKLPEEIKAIKTFERRGWYEEDCDWSLVALAFPEAFDEETLKHAIELARIYLKDKFDVESYLKKRNLS